MFVLNPQYAYLALCVGFVLVWILIYTYSPSTRREQLQMSLICIPGGPLSELLYFRDYWYPESAFPIRIGRIHTIVEDMLFAFAFAGITTVLYQIAVGRSLQRDSTLVGGSRYACLIVTIVSVLLIWGGTNSIFATALGFLAGALWMIARRPDLAWPGALERHALSSGDVKCIPYRLSLDGEWSRHRRKSVVLSVSKHCSYHGAHLGFLIRHTFWAAIRLRPPNALRLNEIFPSRRLSESSVWVALLFLLQCSLFCHRINNYSPIPSPGGQVLE
jgi:type IV secretory pathway TrbD component